MSIIVGDARTALDSLAGGSVQCCVTSPPYFGLRDYGVTGQIGLESTPEAYVAEMVAVFRAVRRVLADDGTLWLNLGDSYAGSWGAQGRRQDAAVHAIDCDMGEDCYCGAVESVSATQIKAAPRKISRTGAIPAGASYKAKDLIGIPWRVAFALQADGWYLRSDIIWHKPNPMPESVTDRPTKAHEYVFLLTKSARYYYDAAALSEPSGGWKNSRFDDGKNAVAHPNVGKRRSGNKERKHGDDAGRPGSHLGRSIPWEGNTRNARSVWSITTRPFKGAHFSTMPPELARRCVLAGSRVGDTVLDPFGGAGTTALVAQQAGRHAVMVELNPAYADIARARLDADAPLFADGAA